MTKQGQSVADQNQDIGKVHKMIQNPVDDSVVVFLGKYNQRYNNFTLNYFLFKTNLILFRNLWNQLGLRRLRWKHSRSQLWKEDPRIHVPPYSALMGPRWQLD